MVLRYCEQSFGSAGLLTHEPQITGPYAKLARRIREITGPVASRVAARRAGVSHDTVKRLWEGDRATEATLIKFGRGYGLANDEINDLLELAEFPRLLDDNEIEPSSDPDVGYVMRRYEGLGPISKRLAKKIIEELHAAEQEGSIGKRPSEDSFRN